MPARIRVRAVVVDASPLAYAGILECLNLGEHTVQGQARNLDEALQQLGATSTDLVVIGPSLSEDESLAVCREILCRWSSIKTIIITKHAGDPFYQADAVFSGAAACLPDTVTHQDCLAAIDEVMSGHLLFPREIMDQAFEPIELTARERAVLKLLAEGKSDREIARALCVEFTTVRTHSKNIIEKFGVHNRQEAVRRARRRGFIK